MRAFRRSSSAFHSPTSWAFLIATFGFAFVWMIFIIFTVTALSCVQAIGISLYPHYGIATIDLFWLGFVALACLTFVNSVRYRPTRQHYTHRVFEVILIFFGLVTVSEWENHVHPGLGDRPVMEFIHDELLMGSGLFFVDEIAPENRFDWREPINDVEPGSFPAFGPSAPGVNDEDFPLGIMGGPANECLCWSKAEENARWQHNLVDQDIFYGFLSLEEADTIRSTLDPIPVEADWCPAIRNLARLPR